MVHEQFRAAIIAAARKAKPGIPDAELETLIARVAASPGFAHCAEFLDDGLRAIAFGDAALEGVVKIALAAPTPAPAQPEFKQINPVDRLGAIYRHQAGERADIEGPALAQRVADDKATPLDRLSHLRATEAPPTKEARRAAENPEVRTDDLQEIRDPAKRLGAFRRRVADTRSIERLRLDQTAYQRKALDPATPPQVRAAANLELTRIAERLKALGQ
jgi:hypothetical protein